MSTDSTKIALVFASYNEAENLSEILTYLSPVLDNQTLIIVADDSGKDYQGHLEKVCKEAMAQSKAQLQFNYSDIKDGRGTAIRRSFERLKETVPSIEHFLEADSDGSHRPEDILKVMYSDSDCDLLIGSRYVSGSEIVGWPISRKILSKFLNTTIPVLLSVPAKDLTNGLRRYSPRAVELILEKPARNKGFIYLSEVAETIARAQLTISEVPIRFENRVHGSSTVGFSELFRSLSGLFGLIFQRPQKPS